MTFFDRSFWFRLIFEVKWSFSVWIYGYRGVFKVTVWFSMRVDDRIRLFLGSDGNPRGWIHGYRWTPKATEPFSRRFGDLCFGLMVVLRTMRRWSQEESEGYCGFRFGFKAKQWGLVPGRDWKEYELFLGFSIDVLLTYWLTWWSCLVSPAALCSIWWWSVVNRLCFWWWDISHGSLDSIRSFFHHWNFDCLTIGFILASGYLEVEELILVKEETEIESSNMMVPGGGRYLLRLPLVFRLYWEFEFLELSFNGIQFLDCVVLLSAFEFVLVAVWIWAADQRYFRLKTIEKSGQIEEFFNRWLSNDRSGRALFSLTRANVGGQNFPKRYDVGRLCLDFECMELSFSGCNKRFYYGLISALLWLVVHTIRVKISRFNCDWVSLKKNQRNEGHNLTHYGTVKDFTGGRNPPKYTRLINEGFELELSRTWE